MTDTDLEQLIARLEAASVGSLELSAEIERDVVGHMVHEWPFWFRATSFDGVANSAVVPGIPYTESVEAALALWETPEIGRGYPRRGINLFYAVLPGGKMAWVAQAWELRDGNSVIDRVGQGQHRIRPIAACIAALGARAGGGIVV